jgi:starch synthase
MLGIRVLLTHPGTQYSYQLAAQLERLGMLGCFATGFAVGENNRWSHWLPVSWRKKLQRRTVAIPQKKLFILPLLEWKALHQIKKGAKPEQAFYQRNKRFQERIPQRLIEAATVVIGFDTSSWILIERCRLAKKHFILDASIAHPLKQQAIFNALRQQFPGWSAELGQKNGQLIDIELGEMKEAGTIVVASAFTRCSYLEHGIAADLIRINHYGTDLAYFRSKWDASLPVSRETRFLFFSKLSARKGFPWLCGIWQAFHQRFPTTRLVAAGYGEIPEGFEIPAGIDIHGFIHPKDRLALFHSADVFVFPSYFEGFAQVIIEAMASGLPVITTTHTVGPEIITNGEQGCCIEPGDNEALFKAMQFFVDQPGQIETMGRKARQRVEGMTWDAYGERWGEICRSLMPD